MYQRFLYLLADLNPVLGNEAVPNAVADITQAAGDAAAVVPSADMGLMGSWWILPVYAVIIIGGYFLLMRPQRKREKKMKEMQAAIKTGDNVVTSGGFYGRVADVGEDCFIIEFGTSRGIRVPVQKSDVIGIKSPKTTPPPKEAIEKKD
jgi:preprotein translocase subunit YajC